MDIDIDKSYGTARAGEPLVFRQGDFGKTLTFNLVNRGAAYIPPSGTVAKFKGREADGRRVEAPAALSGSTVTVVATSAMATATGRYVAAYIELSRSGTVDTTEDIPIVVIGGSDASAEQQLAWVPSAEGGMF